MRWKNVVLRGLLAILIIFDLLLFLEIRRYGWPVILSGQPLGGGRMGITVTRMTASAGDWLMAALLVSVQTAVVYGNWRLGHPKEKRH